MGALGLALAALTATMGAQRPARRLKKLEIPVPVPRLGAGKTSGCVVLVYDSQVLIRLGGTYCVGVQYTIHDVLEKGLKG